MATISKSYAVALAHQAVTHPATVVGSALDVSTKLAMTLALFHASVEAAANTNPGKFLVQVSIPALVYITGFKNQLSPSGIDPHVECCRHFNIDGIEEIHPF